MTEKSQDSAADTGRLEAIWVKRVRRGPMDSKQSARLIAGKGLEDDANLGKKRQVTILSAEQWRDLCDEVGEELDPTVRRANLMVSGIGLPESRGRLLRIGECQVLIHGETRPCRNVTELHPGLDVALDPDWRGGIYGEVVNGGEIAVGDAVSWSEELR